MFLKFSNKKKERKKKEKKKHISDVFFFLSAKKEKNKCQRVRNRPQDVREAFMTPEVH